MRVLRPHPATVIQQTTPRGPVPLRPHAATVATRPSNPTSPAGRSPHPATSQAARMVQRFVEVQRPPDLELPRMGSDHVVDEKRAREMALAYWEYLMNFHDIWGCWPWEWGLLPRTKTYVYERDPKQKARDHLEYVRARKQLRAEAEMEAQIQKTNQNRKEARTRLDLLRYLHTVAPEMRARMNEAGSEAAKQRVIDDFLRECKGRFPDIQIIHPSEFQRMIANSEYLYTYLRSGFEQVLYKWDQLDGDTDQADFVTDVLANDKGYPRVVNFANNFLPLRARTMATVLMTYLFGLANTNIFTGAWGDERSVGEQIEAQVKEGLSDQNRFALWMRIFGELSQRLHLRTGQAFRLYVTKNARSLADALQGTLSPKEIELGLTKYLEVCARAIFSEFVEERAVAEENLELAWNAFQMQFAGVDVRMAAQGKYNVNDQFTHRATGVKYEIVEVGGMSKKYKLRRVG